MILEIPEDVIADINRHGELSYPEEGAGFLLGHYQPDRRRVAAIMTVSNAREDTARHNRYLLTPQDYFQGEQEAARRGLDIVGVFHSHPDHPNRPSDFDRSWAMPTFSYLITSIISGQAGDSRSWRLRDDRLGFDEESLILTKSANNRS